VLKSLRARNVALLIGIVLMGQLLAVALLYVLAVRPQAERIGGIMARNVAAISMTMESLSPPERAKLIKRINADGAIRIMDGNREPPEDRSVPTMVEKIFMRSFARAMDKGDVVIWHGGQSGQLWVRVTLGGELYWMSYERPKGWTPNGALLASFLIAVTMALIAGILIQRRIAEPLKALAAAADATERNAVPPELPDDGPTELAAVARSFNAMRYRLTEQDSRRTHMLAAISHDLRTPLSKIRLEIAMIPGLHADSEAMIGRQLDRLDAMLGQFLDFGRGADTETPTRIDLRELLEETAEDLGTTLKLDSSGPAFALARPVAARRAIANILRNAEIYGAPPIEASVRQEGGLHVITIRDHGKGVNESDLARLQEPFFRSDHARGISSGSGLGFAIVKEAAEADGGWLTISNAPDSGLLVELALPVDEQYFINSTCSKSSSTGVARPKIETETLTRFFSKSSSSTAPLKLAKGPSRTFT
jgi:two-component system osmolarity sensor histidine kinase EnvZ